ncbi:hypothetical protein AB4463_11905 [Vibrio cyclitrophicus]
MKSIKLDLNKAEYDEQFSSQDLWQRQAATALVKHLECFGKQASMMLSYESKSGSSRYGSQNIHNAILISGGRGTGKSVFLKNAEALWGDYVKTEKGKTLPKLYFTPLIDPTLLQDHDSFTNVLVAHIYNQVIDALSSCVLQKEAENQEKNKQDFYKALRNLAEAIEQPGERSDHTGLDKIIQYSSGIKIDALFYEFVAAAKNILKCDAIVLPIDDVDMALDKAYSVLEEIRRRLSCPDIIPLVSGDLELYQHLVKLNLIQSLSGSFGEKNLYGDQKSGKLAEAYLAKVLPNHYRIALKPIEDLVSYLTIIDPELSTSNNEKSYTKYQVDSKKYFFGPINGEEKSTDYPLPTSAREVGQLIRLLPPSTMHKDGVNCKTSLEDWESMLIWSEGMQHGAGYALARSAIQLVHKSKAFRLNQLMAFNVQEQANERLPWAQYDFIAEQKVSAESFDKKTNNFLLSCTVNDKILRSMPPLEMHTDNMSVTETNAKNVKNPIALAIYTHWAYYSTQGYQQRKIFFSRAFDLLATSLFMAAASNTSEVDEHGKAELIDKDKRNKFREILNTVPFYSIHALNPTKTVEEDLSKEGSIAENLESDHEEGDSALVDQFSGHLLQWTKDNQLDVQAYIKDSTRLVALLSAVFNKAFSQLNLLRNLYHKGEHPEEQLLDGILRFRYIVANAFGFFIKSKGVVPANLALTTSHITLREKATFANSSSTYKRNVSWVDLPEKVDDSLGEDEGSEQTGPTLSSTEVIEARFVKAVMNHPVFTQLGVDINSCVSEQSALITNSSGSPRKQSLTDSQAKEKRKKAGEKFASITALAGKGKQYLSPDALSKEIGDGEMPLESMEELWNKLKEELEKSERSEFAKNHLKVFDALANKLGRNLDV